MSGIVDFLKRWAAHLVDPCCACERDDDRGEDGEGLDPTLGVPTIERYQDGMWYEVPLLHLMPGQYFRLRQTDGQLILDEATGQPKVFKSTSFPMIDVEHPLDPGQTLTVKFAFDDWEEKPPADALVAPEPTTSVSPADDKP